MKPYTKDVTQIYEKCTFVKLSYRRCYIAILPPGQPEFCLGTLEEGPRQYGREPGLCLQYRSRHPGYTKGQRRSDSRVFHLQQDRRTALHCLPELGERPGREDRTMDFREVVCHLLDAVESTGKTPVTAKQGD
ncbi:hypothetical protein NDU88_002508 [Pleurodeles waltl]|uniref:Uncharacterized protein n=1 Tax=Pleurodeles waltl TaxID=8319 RepID=A0AAV7SAL4_PLEWA|nr:hypothetical protein NDU88_002508 [Pleurodeles waltl]